MNRFCILMIILLVPFNVFGISDFAGQGKTLITWDELMMSKIDPSRYFATPGGGHGVHLAGGEVKPEPKPEPKLNCKPEPEVKPDCKPKPHKCWPFKFHPVKDCTPKVKPEHKAKPDCKHAHDKPACKADRKDTGHKSECAKLSGDKPGSKPAGLRGHSFGFGRQGLCGKGGHGPGKGHGHGHGR